MIEGLSSAYQGPHAPSMAEREKIRIFLMGSIHMNHENPSLPLQQPDFPPPPPLPISATHLAFFILHLVLKWLFLLEV